LTRVGFSASRTRTGRRSFSIPRRRGPGSRRTRTRVFGTVAYAVLFALLGILIASRYAAVARIGYEITELKAEVAGLERENERLRLDIAQLRSVDRIEEIAVAQLGMERPGEVCIARGEPAAEETLVATSVEGQPGVAFAASRREAGAAETGGTEEREPAGIRGFFAKLLGADSRAAAKTRD